MSPKHATTEEVPLADAVGNLLEECRMILPGVQALFGFQLIAVFNTRFDQILTDSEQVIHLLALALVAISGALIMAPAAYHRQTAPREASEGFIIFASRLLLISLAPLMVGIGLDFYLIARIILQNPLLSLLLAALLVIVFIVAWFVLPALQPLRRMTGTER